MTVSLLHGINFVRPLPQTRQAHDHVLSGPQNPYLANTLLTLSPRRPYAKEYAVPTNRAPDSVFPMVTGIKLFTKNSCVVTLAPKLMPHGIMNMLATQCSNPMATKADMGSHTAMAFPPRVLAALACHTAMQTSQLHSMPRVIACITGNQIE